MRSLSLVFAFWTCASHGRTTQTFNMRMQDETMPTGYLMAEFGQFQQDRRGALHSDVQACARLLLSFNSPALGHRLLRRGAARSPGSPVLLMQGGLERIGQRARKIEMASGLSIDTTESQARACRTYQVPRWKRWISALGFLSMVAAVVLNAGNARAVGLDAAEEQSIDFVEIIKHSLGKAWTGGQAGAGATMIQVLSTMWLHTAMNYQYRYGGSLGSALKTLTDEGGIYRLYQGLPFALVEEPLERFGITAANVGVLALLDAIPSTAGLSISIKTAVVSICAGAWRILIMPVDTTKVALQVRGPRGFKWLRLNVLKKGPGPLFRGAITTAVSTAVGSWPWLMTYNSLDAALPIPGEGRVLLSLLRSAFLGLSASCACGIVTNSLKVVKTTQQTTDLSFQEAVKMVVEADGIKGLFGRGLKTRLLTNGIEGCIFSVFWRYFQGIGSPSELLD